MIWSTDDISDLWEVKPLARLTTKVGSGATPRGGRASYPSHGVPFIRSQNVHFDGFSREGLAFLNDDQAKELNAVTVEPGDVLLNITGASIGRVCVAPKEMTGARVNQHVCIIRPSAVRSTFLAQYLASPQVQDAISLGNYGFTREALTKTQILELPVPIPPLPQQDALIAMLDEVSGRRFQAAFRVASAKRAIKRFRQSLLAAACFGRLTVDWRERNKDGPPGVGAKVKPRPKKIRGIDGYDLGELPDSWTWVQVDDVLPPGGIFDGPFGSNLKTSDYTEAGARVIRLENIGHLKFISSKQTFVSMSKYKTLMKHAVHSGDVIFSSFVEEQIRVCVLPDDLEAFAIAKADCFTLRPKEGIYPPYLALQLASPSSYRNLISDVHGATRPRVNTTQVRSLPIALCSLREQQEIVRRFAALNLIADKVTADLDTAGLRLEASAHAILGKAFRGELNASAGSNVEPAAEEV